jgi:hypothetical protein
VKFEKMKMYQLMSAGMNAAPSMFGWSRDITCMYF